MHLSKKKRTRPRNQALDQESVHEKKTRSRKTIMEKENKLWTKKNDPEKKCLNFEFYFQQL